MAADSSTHLDIVEWIEKVIDSCENRHHFNNTRELVYLFEKALETEGIVYEVRYFLAGRLLDRIYNRETEIQQN